jgi:hypothetical protein
MSVAPRPTAEIFARRMSLVAEVTALNARQLRLRQILGGIEVELMLGGDVPGDGLRQRDGDARAEMAECDRLKEALEARIAALDRELAASSP